MRTENAKAKDVLQARFFKLTIMSLILSFAIISIHAAANAAASKKKKKPAVTTQSAYDLGMSLTQKGDFKSAHNAFLKADKDKANDPDTLNMLGYTARKIGNFEAALGYYKRALALRPKFPQAREYLAQALIELTMKEVKLLKSYGPEGEKLANQVLTTMKLHAKGASAPRPFSSY